MHVNIYTYMQVYPRDMRVSPILWSKFRDEGLGLRPSREDAELTPAV